MDITIRKAQICDIPDIIKMNTELNDVVSTEDWITESLQRNDRETVLVAVHGDRPIGFVCGQLYKSICYPNGAQSEISELFVCEEYRGNGIAARLVKALEAEFIKNNASEIILKTGRDNLSARKVYEKCGYEDYGEVVYFKEIER